MKRLILTLTFLSLLIVSCDSPVSNSGPTDDTSLIKVGQIRQGAVLTSMPLAKLDSARKDILLRFSARHGYGWRASWPIKA